MRGTRVLLVWSVLAGAALSAAIWPLVARSRQAAFSRIERQRERDAQRAKAVVPDVAGFAGEIEIGGGARLTVRLARLHAGARQQRFDASALARRYGLGTGEPFVCEIVARGASSTQPSSIIRPGVLRSIAIRDDGGQALAPFPAAPSPSDTEPSDPLATLLAPPSDALRSGSAVSVILWGREPGPGAHVAGLESGEVALAPTQLATRDIDAALARIDAPPPTGGPK